MARLIVESPLGPLTLIGDGTALTAIDWGRFGDDAPDAVVMETARQLDEYFAGRRRDFDLPLKPAGTVFRRGVWAAMLAIPYGGTVTYGGMARELGSGPRPVGGACGANPIPIIIPCHRVLASGGAPGGYSGLGGLDTKGWLLALERRHAPAGDGTGRDTLQPALL